MINSAGLDLIKSFEGLRLKAYRDSVGVLTIGYGHTRNVKPNQVITPSQAVELLKEDLKDAEAGVDRLVTVPLNPNQRAALVSFTFNLGQGNLAKSTLLRKVNAGDFSGAAEEFGKWVNAGGERLPGLVRRREAEKKLFQSGTPQVSRPTLRRGSKGPEVAALQRKLQIRADSVFGYGTEAAVMKFQIAHGLKADGVVGPATNLALFGSEDRQTWSEFREDE